MSARLARSPSAGRCLIGAPRAGFYRELLNSDAGAYGGSNAGNNGGTYSEPVASHGFEHSLSLRLPPLGIVFLRPV